MNKRAHRDEEATIRAFFLPRRRIRWIERLASPKTRPKMLDALNHCADLDPRFASGLSGNVDILDELRSRGAPSICYVISCADEIDGLEMPLEQALEAAERIGWGTVISCIPGKLAYYLDECGERRFVLQRDADSAESESHG